MSDADVARGWSAVLLFCCLRRRRKLQNATATPHGKVKQQSDASSMSSPPSDGASGDAEGPLKTDVVPYSQYRKSRLDDIRLDLGLQGSRSTEPILRQLQKAVEGIAGSAFWLPPAHHRVKRWRKRANFFLPRIKDNLLFPAPGQNDSLTPRSKAALENEKNKFGESTSVESPVASPESDVAGELKASKSSGELRSKKSASDVMLQPPKTPERQELPARPSPPPVQAPANIVAVSLLIRFVLTSMRRQCMFLLKGSICGCFSLMAVPV